MDFGDAIRHMKIGRKVARQGWNGKDMWLIYVEGQPSVPLRPGTPYATALNAAAGDTVTINPHIDMMTADGKMQPGWLASQTDMLANDWVVVE